MFRTVLFGITYAVCFLYDACAAEDDRSQRPAMPAASESRSVTSAQVWRQVDQENLLYIDTEYGQILVELYPEIAPVHVERIKTLTRQKFYDFITFHRVIDGFMNQTGDPKGNGTGSSALPNIEAEFTFRRAPEMTFTQIATQLLDARNPSAGRIGVGFYKALAIMSHPSSQAILTKDGKVEAYAIHCPGIASMARSSNPNSANSQFFLMRGASPWLDGQYSIWGRVVWGREYLTKFRVGDKGQNPDFVPDKINKVRVGTDLDERERIEIEVMRTDQPWFLDFLQQQKSVDGQDLAICDIVPPARIQP